MLILATNPSGYSDPVTLATKILVILGYGDPDH